MSHHVLVAACGDKTHQVLCELLRRTGLTVDSATTVSDAMDVLQYTPSLMVVDLAMDNRTGLDVIKAARSEGFLSMLAVICAPADAPRFEWIPKYCPDAIFGKPFNFSDFADWLSEFDANRLIPASLASRRHDYHTMYQAA